MSEKHKSLLMALTFCMMIAGLIGYYLHYAYQHEKHAAEDRISATSYLIGEWITGAFAQSDYVLRDITSAVNQEELAYRTRRA
jgi:hypothetical protein